MAQFNDLIVTGVARIVKNFTIVDKAECDSDGNVISSTYMKKGVDRVTAGRKSGTIASSYTTAEGSGTTSSANYTHAEGYSTTASGNYASHAEGYQTTASGTYGTHAEGFGTTASSNYSHAEGFFTTATGSSYIHTEGYYTTSSGYASYVTGYYTQANTGYQFVCGKYNAYDSNSVFIIGNGTSTSARSNGFTVSTAGMVTMKYTGGNTPCCGMASAQTIPNLIDEVKCLNGAMGSVYITTAYTLNSITIAAGWYNYLYIPRSTGGKDGGANDTNTTYGALLLLGMNVYNKGYFIVYNSGSIVALRSIIA